MNLPVNDVWTGPAALPPKTHGRSDPDAAIGVPWTVDPATHRLLAADYLASPNCDARPDPADLSLLVIHNISLPPDQFGGYSGGTYIDDLFLNRLDPAAHPYFAGIAGLTVSSHLCIFRDGSIRQYVPFDQRAWHAGASEWRGRMRCNDFAIGIELEGSDFQPFTDAQYAALIASTCALLAAYSTLSADAIAGHSDIAPARKTDPGPHFDWPRYRAGLSPS